jgi:histone arginine demethylase JMJD6
MGWQSKMEDARRKHRPSLKDWECDGLFEAFPDFVKHLVSLGNYQAFLLPNSDHPTRLPAILDANQLGLDHFHSKYEARGIPCVIRSIPQVEGWTAPERWQLDRLNVDQDLLDRKFKCGEDDDGRSIKIKLRHFLEYLHNNKDDSPLYIFDSGFDDDRVAMRILTDYKVPSYFKDDLFRLVSESRRPPYRWWLIGPERSGTTVHIDPLATSAWNTLLCGQKRWVLFPPNVPKHVVKGKGLIRKDEDDEAIHYFMYILPRIKRRAHQVGNSGDYENFACYEFTQNPGETCFIPNGWWHAVLNLSHTVGITQNFCSPRNFDRVWEKTRSGRKLMASKWLNALEISYPSLAERAKYLNRRDKYVLKYDPEELKRKDEAKRQKHRAEHEKKVRERERERERANGQNASSQRTKSFEGPRQGSPSSVSDIERELKRSRHVSPP